MANLVEFLVKLQDLASAPLQKLGQTGLSAFAKMDAGMAKVSGNTSTLGTNISQLDTKIKQLERSSSRATSSLSGLFRTGLAIAGIGSLAFIGKDIMQAGIGRQMDLTGLEVLLGKGPGDLLNSQLIDFAKKSIYGNEVFNEGKLMAGSGVKAGNIMPVLNMIGDIAMGDKERMKSIALAFSEASSTGYLTGRQELMMRTALFNPLESLAAITHKSGGQLKKDMEKGKISIDMLVKAMEYATGPMGRWHNMMEKLQDTPAGKWTAFTGTLRTLAGTIGLALLPALGHLTDFMSMLINNQDQLIGVAWSIGAMTVAWGAYTVATNWAAISAGALEIAAYWPLAAVGAVVYAITQMTDYTKGYGDMMDSVSLKSADFTKASQDSAEAVTLAWTPLKYFLDTLSYTFLQLKLTMLDTFERISNVLNAKSEGGIFGLQKAQMKAFFGETEAGKRSKYASDIYQWGLNNVDPKKPKEGWGMMGAPFKDAKSYGIDDPTKGTPLGGKGAGKYQGTTPGTGGGTLGGDTTSAITGGGVRNISININKEMVGKIELHSLNIKEGLTELEDLVRDVFLRIVNSAATAIS